MAEKVLEMLFTFGEANAAAQRPANLDAISALVSEVITHCGLTVRQSADSVQQAKNNWASLLLYTETWIAANEEVSASALTELAQKFSSNGSFISEADAAAWLLCFLPKIPAPATVAAAPASADTAALAVAISKTVDPLVKAREKATEAYSKKLAGEGLASHPERPRLSLDEFGSCIDGESVNYKSLQKWLSITPSEAWKQFDETPLTALELRIMSAHHSAVSGIQSVKSVTDALVALIKLRPRYVAYLAKMAVQKIVHDDFSVKDLVMPPGSVRDDATMPYGLLSGSVSEESTMSIEDDSPVCCAISQYLSGASSTINWRFFGNAVRAMAPGTAADKIPVSLVPGSEMKDGKPKDVVGSPWCDGAADFLATLGMGFVEIHLKVFGGEKARQDEMKQMVRLMQQGARGSPAHQQATVDFARRFAKGLDKAKGDYVDGGQSTGDFSALLVHPSNNKVIAEFDPPLTSFVSQHHRILFLRSVEAAFKESEAQLDASTEGKVEKRPRATSPPLSESAEYGKP